MYKSPALFLAGLLMLTNSRLPDLRSAFEKKLAHCSDADLHKEMDLINQKKSKLSRAQRNEFCWYYKRKFPGERNG